MSPKSAERPTIQSQPSEFEHVVTLVDFHFQHSRESRQRIGGEIFAVSQPCDTSLPPARYPASSRGDSLDIPMFSNPSPRPSGPKTIPHQMIDMESLKLPPLQRVISPSQASTVSSPLLRQPSESNHLFSPKGSPKVYSNASPKVYSNASPKVYTKEYPNGSGVGSPSIPHVGSPGFPTTNTLEKDLSMGASTMELYLDGELETYDTLRSVRILSHSPSPKTSLPAGVQKYVADTIPPDTSAETPIEDVNKEDPLALPPLEAVSRGDTMESLGLPCVLEQHEEDEAFIEALMKKMDVISEETRKVEESVEIEDGMDGNREMDNNAEELVEENDESFQKMEGDRSMSIRTMRTTQRYAINAAKYDFSADDDDPAETDKDSVINNSADGDSSITQLSYHSSAKQSQLYPEDYLSTRSGSQAMDRRSGTDRTLPTGMVQEPSSINDR